MTTHVSECEITVAATADLSGAKYKCINFDGTIAQAADHAKVAGICRFVVTSGGHASAIVHGITKALVGGTVTTPGWPLKVANSGWLVAAASGDMAVARLASASAAASGDMSPVLAGFMSPSIWGG